MDTFIRMVVRTFALILLTLTAAGAAPSPALLITTLPNVQPVSPEQVLSGSMADQFQPLRNDELVIMGKEAQWLRIVVNRDFPAEMTPQLVMTQPYRKTLEAWRPGDREPVRRATYGPNADLNHSTLFHVVPLPHGLHRGDTIYLRSTALDSRASRFTIESLDYVHRVDMSFGRMRSFVLTSLSIVAFLALAFWASLRQRGYGYLALTLTAQVIALAIEGGDVRGFTWMLEWVQDRRTNLLLNTTAVLTSVRFLMFFLSLPALQPRVARLLNACSAVLLALIAVSTVQVWYTSALIGNLVLLIIIATIFKAATHAIRNRQREAFFLLTAWAPLMVVLVVRVGAMQNWWPEFQWLEFAFPFALTFSGFGLLLGLTDKLHQLRRDHDKARHRAAHDGLTGVLSRAAIDEALRDAAEGARANGKPLSVVFLDIDRFKTINDDHGHATGDEVLRIVAARARNRLRPLDLFGRFGGDEMLIGLVDANLTEAMQIAEHIRAAIANSPISIEGHCLRVGVSLGVAQLQPGESLPHLLKRADTALYTSKADGRGRVTSADSASAITAALA
ncbi:MAG: GGDEF domain-containing protein [Lysobacter sp.]